MDNLCITQERLQWRNSEYMNTSNAIKEKNSRENYAIELRKKHRLSNYQSK